MTSRRSGPGGERCAAAGLVLLLSCAGWGSAAIQGPAQPGAAGVDEEDRDSYFPEQPLLSPNPRLRAWVRTSRALRLQVRLEDLEGGTEVVLSVPSPRLFLPRDADYLYALVADAEGGFLLFDRPRFHGVAIFDRHGEEVRRVERPGEVIFAQLPDGRFALAEEGGVGGYSATGEELWRRELPQVDRLEAAPPAAFTAGRYLGESGERTSGMLLAASGETLTERRGPVDRPPALLLYEPEAQRLLLSQRRPEGPWRLIMEQEGQTLWEVEHACNPTSADVADGDLAVLASCLDPADDSRFPKELWLYQADTGEARERRDLGELISPSGRYRLRWTGSGRLEVDVGSEVRELDLTREGEP